MTRNVVVITGASSGIGRATAARFARHRASLVLAARSRRSLDEVASQCRAAGAEVLVVPTDVADSAAVDSLVSAAIARFGRIDVWVGAASVYGYGTIEAMPPHVFRRIVETNLFGQVYGVRAVLPVFRKQRHGTFVLIGSVYSKVTSPYVAAYATSKFGMYAFAEVLRHELRSLRRIHVCVVLPATIDTPIYQHAANYTGERVHPLPPVASAERVARAIVRLSAHPKPVTIVGWTQRTMIPLHAAMPSVYSRMIVPTMNLLALRRGAVDQTSGTVFNPDPGSNRVNGGWRSPGWRAVLLTGLALAALSRVRAARA